MNVIDRVEQSTACKVINLTEAEKDIYCGSGWKFARFEDGNLVGFYDPMETEYQADTTAMVEDMSENMTAWIANAVGEVWLVMCSCYQLCEPRRVALTGEFSAALPAALNLFTEALIEE